MPMPATRCDDDATIAADADDDDATDDDDDDDVPLEIPLWNEQRLPRCVALNFRYTVSP